MSEVLPHGPTPADPMEFRRLSPLTPIAKSGIWLVAAIFAVGRDAFNDKRGLSAAPFIAGGIVLLGLLTGFASWWRTRFRITNDELRIDTGLISQQSRRVRLDRIVGIDVNQPFIARMLSVAELRIETATKDSDVTLAYLPLAEAHRIRSVLLRRRDASRDPQAPDETQTAAPDSAAHVLVTVPIKWHLVSILASPESVGLAMVGVAAVGMWSAGMDLGAFGFSIAGILGLAASFVRKLVGRWNWQVAAVPTGVQVRHGMFNLTTQTFHVGRLQGLTVREPALWRPWRLASLEISVAGGVKGGEEDAKGLVLPVSERALVWQLARDLLSADPDAVELTPAGRRARWVAPLSAPWLGFGYDERLLVSRRGWLSRRTTIVPLARAQSFTATSGPIQRVLGLADLRVDSPLGTTPLTAPERDLRDARAAVVGASAAAHVARAASAQGGKRIAAPIGAKVQSSPRDAS